MGTLSKTNFNFSGNTFEVIVLKDYNGKNKPYFVAKRVGEALGYVRTADAIRNHCPDRFEFWALCQEVGDLPTFDLHPQTNFIPEPDVYALIFGSHLPQAKEFK